MGQPTHFLPGRQWGMFTVTVPKEFTSAEQRLTWTIVANGQTTSIPLRLHPDYDVNPFSDVAVKNTPPAIRLAENGARHERAARAARRRAGAHDREGLAPLLLPLWAADDGKFASGDDGAAAEPARPVGLIWSKYRGPGTVTFDKATPPMEILAGGAAQRPVPRQGHGDGALQRAGRLCAARHRQRLLGRRRLR